MWAAVWLVLCGLSPAHAATQSFGSVLATEAPPAAGRENQNRDGEECQRLRPVVWPISLVARRAHIARLQQARARCIDSPDFLSALGALILEDGEPEQALIWLERALLLDPDNRGAQADHALALASLGQPEALQQLLRDWKGRGDLPPALRNKLYPPETQLAYAFPPVRLGQLQAPVWGTQGEISVVFGRESNLDRSPKLTELTLTIPFEGPLVLPVVSQPRAGRATISAASFQMAYAPAPGSVLRSGLSFTDRSAGAQHGTDWRQVQWTASGSQQLGWLRGQLEASTSWIGGPLSEAYRLQRTTSSLDADVGDCRLRAAYESERRRQALTESFNSRTTAWQAGWQCALPFAPAWTASAFVRRGRDTPDGTERPGDEQQLKTSGLRLVGTLPTGTRLDAGLRSSSIKDATGYSPLLDGGAVRRIDLRQYSLELAQPLDKLGWAGLEASVQYLSARQTSNLALFQYRADSLYGGLRWSW